MVLFRIIQKLVTAKHGKCTPPTLRYVVEVPSVLGSARELRKVQIYNEQLRDLLLPESMPVHERSNVTIREDIKGRILLTGLQSIPINSIDDLLAALNHGSTIRQTDSTAINAKSSRSHAIFSLRLVQRKSSGSLMSTKEKRRSVPVESYVANDSIVTIESKLHFVDLAGSERL